MGACIRCGRFATGDRTHHMPSRRAQNALISGRWVLGVCLHMPAGRQVSHVSQGGWCKAAEPPQVRATYQPTWWLSTRDQPCNKCVAAGSGSTSKPVGAGTRTMDEVS